jgi:prephenate dehydrogenase
VSAVRRVAIVGVGMIGGSLGLALRARLPTIAVHGVTRDQRQAAEALRSGAVTSAGAGLEEAAGADVAVIATPLAAMPQVLRALDRAMPQGLVTDVGSVKERVVVWAADALARPDRFLGGHPMAGRTETGLGAAQASLFEGAPWIFTPRPDQDLERFEGWFACVRAVGAHPVFMEPQEHDRRIAMVSHAAFLLSAAYAGAVGSSEDSERTAALAGPGFRDMIRLATGDPRLYAAIAEYNRGPLLSAVDSLEASLDEFRRRLLAGDSSVEELFSASRSRARGWLRA